MLDFGNTDAHSNSIGFSDDAALDAPAAWTAAYWVHVYNSQGAGTWPLFEDRDGSGGWLLFLSGNGQSAQNNNGAPLNTNSGVALAIGSLLSVVVTWDGANIRFYYQGALVAGPLGNGTAPAANAAVTRIGNNAGAGRGCRMGHVMWWPLALSADEVLLYHQGQRIPRRQDLKFWCKGISSPGRDEISGVAGTVSGTVNVVASQVDSYYPEGAVPHAAITATRRATSRRLLQFNRQRTVHAIAAPLEFLDLRVGDDFSGSHPAGASADGAGWPETRHLRRPLRVIRRGYTPGRRQVSLLGEDLRSTLRLFTMYDAMETQKIASPIEDGIARSSVGAHRAYFRGSTGYVEDTDGVIRAFLPDQLRATARGSLIEHFHTQRLRNSAFVSGLSTWTQVGTGVNGSAITLDTTRLWFEVNVTPQSARFVAGNPHAANLFLQQTTGSFNSNFVVAFWYDGDASSALGWTLQRASDSQYWNDSTEAWQVALVVNTLAASTTRVKRHSKRVTVGGSTTYTLAYGLPSGGTASRALNVYNAQLETPLLASIGQGWASAPIVSLDTTAVGRADNLGWTNHAGRRVWPMERGSLIIRGRPLFGTADAVNAGLLTLLGLYHDDNNRMDLYVDPANERVGITFVSGGTAREAVSQTFTHDAEAALVVGVRWASLADKELDSLYGAAPSGERWFDVWVATAAAAAARGTGQSGVPLTEAARSFMRVGSSSGAVSGAIQFGGFIGRPRIVPFVLSDLEMQRWMRL